MYIGVKKLGFSEKEVGRMTIAKFNALYRAYQDDFDLELMMQLKGITYEKLKNMSSASNDEEIVYF